MDEDESLEQARHKKLRQRLAEMQQQQQAEQQTKLALQQVVEPDAYERLMNVKLASPELYEQVVGMLIYLAQQKKLSGKVSDEKIRDLLARVAGGRHDTKIEMKKK